MSKTGRGGAYTHLAAYNTPPELALAALLWWHQRLVAIGEKPSENRCIHRCIHVIVSL